MISTTPSAGCRPTNAPAPTFCSRPPFRTWRPCVRVCSSLSKPVNFMVGIPGKSFSVAELAAAGVRRISLATSLYRAAMTGLIAAAREIRESGTFNYLQHSVSSAEFSNYFRAPNESGMKLVHCVPARHSAAILAHFQRSHREFHGAVRLQAAHAGRYGRLVRRKARRELSRHRYGRRRGRAHGLRELRAISRAPGVQVHGGAFGLCRCALPRPGSGPQASRGRHRRGREAGLSRDGRRHRRVERREHQAAREPGLHFLRHRASGGIQIRALAGPGVLPAHTAHAG